jgi:hypothetical protein
MAYKLSTDVLNSFPNQNDYDSYAAKKKLPLAKEFKKFGTQYTSYWSGWRFWTLP